MRSEFRPVHLEVEKEKLFDVLKKAEERLEEEKRAYAEMHKREHSWWQRLLQIFR